MTTLHFDAADEEDLRKTGFSKVGKHQKPQIYCETGEVIPDDLIAKMDTSSKFNH